MMKGELFSQQFIPKLIGGTKIRTSRPIKEKIPSAGFVSKNGNTWGWSFPESGEDVHILIPRRNIGDIMYVRESAMIQSMKNYEKAVKLIFKADNKLQEFNISNEFYDKLLHYPQNKWLSPYWLTREAARIFLRITNVKVQNIADMTEQDALDDGFKPEFEEPTDWSFTAREMFLKYWRSQYGYDFPWMWVYEFERCDNPELLGGDQS